MTRLSHALLLDCPRLFFSVKETNTNGKQSIRRMWSDCRISAKRWHWCSFFWLSHTEIYWPRSASAAGYLKYHTRGDLWGDCTIGESISSVGSIWSDLTFLSMTSISRQDQSTFASWVNCLNDDQSISSKKLNILKKLLLLLLLLLFLSKPFEWWR